MGRLIQKGAIQMRQISGQRQSCAFWGRVWLGGLLWLGLHVGALAQADSLPPPSGDVMLTVSGAITRTNADGEARLDQAMLDALPRKTLHTSTSVTDGVHRFDGVLVRDLLAYVGATGQTVTATALNDYVISFEREEFDRYDVLAAWAMDDEQLTPSDKGPLWIVYPRDSYAELQDIRYDYRWVWQLVQLDVR